MKFNPIAIAALTALTALTASAQASTLYGTEYAAVTPLYAVDQSTGALAAGASTGVGSITDLASSGTNGVVWGIQSSTNTLYQFDAASGATLGTVAVTGARGVTGAPENIVSIALDGANGVLYGTTAASFGGFNDLFRINPNTGAATLVGNLQIDKMYALAFDPVGGKLYGANGEIGESSFLWQIDTTVGAAFAVGQLGTTGNFDIAFRPEDNALFLASSATASLYTVNLGTAATTLVGPYGNATNIAGLAFAVPEPSTYALMLAGVAAVGSLARRRRG